MNLRLNLSASVACLLIGVGSIASADLSRQPTGGYAGQPDIPASVDVQALDRSEFATLYPGVLTEHEKEAVEAYYALNHAINTRGEIDVAALIAGTLPADTPGLGPVLKVTADWVAYQNTRIDPLNPIWTDAAVAGAAGYNGVPAFPTFGAHDDSVMTPWPVTVRDRLMVSELNHSVTNYEPVYAGDTLYTVINHRDVVDLTPVEGATRRAVALMSQASIYNQDGDKVSDVIFRVTEQLSIFADRANAPENPGFFDVWEAPNWMARPEHKYTDEDWDFILSTWAAEDIRGSEPRYWEDVQVGDKPTATLDGPIEQGPTPTWGLGMGSGGSVTLHAETLDGLIQNPTDGIYRMADPNDQIPAKPDPIVFEGAPPAPPAPGAIDVANIHTSEVMRGPLVNFLARDYAIRHVTNWMGDAGWLKTISWSIMDPRSHWENGLPAVPNPYALRYVSRIPGMEDAYVSAHGISKDVAYVQSVVTDKRVVNGAFEVELIWWVETIEGDIWEEGMAVVQLPSRTLGTATAVPAH